ncbi:MAG: hypothetical protein QM796_15365 [Chthoniobacteraceae bacterium]
MTISSFLETLKTQRWDDHRFYHHSRINQALHFLSALSFLTAYATVFKYPAFAVLLGWLFGMTSRQAGHFFFEPHEYDDVNHATHDHKEEIKVGYNLFRKVILMAIWALSPLLLWASPTLFGLLPVPANAGDFLNNLAILWLALGIGGLLFRTIHLFFIKDVENGLAWMTKILTDPFNDLMLYHKAPLCLMRGELMDPMLHVHHGAPVEEEDEDDGLNPVQERH